MPFEIGSTLKKYRNEAKISVKQISDILINKGFKASEKTIYSWESGNSQPSPDALLIMCDAYGIKDILSAFGYDGYNKDGSIILNIDETDLIEKYRIIERYSPKGKESVDFILNREYEIVIETHDAEKSRPQSIARMVSYQEKIHNTPNITKAAHERTDIEVTPEMRLHDDKIMEDGNF